MYNDELYHYGVKGMKWGVRRYQKKDGSLTYAGKKRYSEYSKETIGELNDMQSKLQSKQQKIASKASKLKSKYDAATTDEDRERIAKKSGKLEKKYNELEAKSQGIDKTRDQLTAKKQEQLRNSTNAIDLYKNRDLLTRNEINDRINRINDEARLRELAEKSLPTKVSTFDKVNNLVVKGQKIYNSPAVQLAMKEVKKRNQKEFDVADFYKNIDKKSNQEIQEVKQRVTNQKIIEKYVNETRPSGTHYSGVISDSKTTTGKHFVDSLVSDSSIKDTKVSSISDSSAMYHLKL